MVTSLSQFRIQYPEGGLVTELISIHDGQYIVRAVVSNQGITLGSGLANSVDVQIAEDKARDRALAVVGIFADGAQPKTPPAAPAATPKKIEPTAKPTAKPMGEEKNVSVSKSSAVTPAPSQQREDPPQPYDPDQTILAEPVPSESVEEEEDLGPPIDDVKEEPAVPPETKVSAAVIALENFNTSAVPVDLSDVIAQTDVELTRLGWTSVQGREYLEKTYGKRSRQQLTDEDLMSFLLYLEEQP